MLRALHADEAACSLLAATTASSVRQPAGNQVLDSSPHGGSMTRGSTVRIEVADGQRLACAHLYTRPAPAQGLKTVRDAEHGGFSWNFSTASSDLPSRPQSCTALATAASQYRMKTSKF
jgi:hypothetical protein